MKLPVLAPAVVRGSVSWPTRLPARGSAVPGIEPAQGAVVQCVPPTPYGCICDNGVATCCSDSNGCNTDANGACKCITGREQ